MTKNKSNILACLENYLKDVPNTPADADTCALIVDGLALVHMLSPGPSKTFEDYEEYYVPICR